MLARFVSGGWYPGFVPPIAAHLRRTFCRLPHVLPIAARSADCRAWRTHGWQGRAGRSQGWLAGQCWHVPPIDARRAGRVGRVGWRLPVDAMRCVLRRLPVDALRYGTLYATRARARAMIGVALPA